MSKNTFFTGQPILNQLLSLIDRNSVKSLARSGHYDRYYKHFDTFTHLVSMLYCCLNKCTSSREVVSGMKASHSKLESGSFIVFDKGYVDYSEYERIGKQGAFFVTRQKKDASYEVIHSKELSAKSIALGVQQDQVLIQGTRTQREKIRLNVRMLTFFDRESGRTFEFLTNNFSLLPEEIADIYKKRSLIEILFKRIKQNFPLKYFLGDSENAIKIQIWCAFISDLLIKLVQVKIKRKWAFSNLSSIIRLHLMSYINLFNFLNNPEKLSVERAKSNQLKITGLEINFKTYYSIS